jgi:hypothetical protein
MQTSGNYVLNNKDYNYEFAPAKAQDKDPVKRVPFTPNFATNNFPTKYVKRAFYFERNDTVLSLLDQFYSYSENPEYYLDYNLQELEFFYKNASEEITKLLGFEKLICSAVERLSNYIELNKEFSLHRRLGDRDKKSMNLTSRSRFTSRGGQTKTDKFNNTFDGVTNDPWAPLCPWRMSPTDKKDLLLQEN